MGKKLGINPKAAEARNRKETKKKAAQETMEKKKEDEYWRDDDKHVNRKLERQRERENKLQEERDRKAALKAEYERDMKAAGESLKAKSSKSQQVELPNKVTRHEIEKSLEEDQKQIAKQLKKVNLNPVPLMPNLNRLDDGESATTVDQALELLKK